MPTKTNSNIENRHIAAAELRTITDDNGLKHIVGYAALFNTLSEPLYGFRERIKPGCFRNSLAKDVKCLWNHDRNLILGRTKSGTLMLSEDEIGLKIDCIPPDTEMVRGFMASIDRGDIDQMSFAFLTKTDDWNIENGETVRTLIEVELKDVSPATFPAYTDTSVALRSLDTWKAGQTPENEGNNAESPPGVSILKKRLELKEKNTRRHTQ